jgi:choice-of-anchor A domain-containing protein
MRRGVMWSGLTALGFVVASLGGTRAEAGSFSLGAAGAYTVYVSGDLTRSGGIAEGAIAVGGNASFTSFKIEGVSGDSLVVGGDLTFDSSKVTTGDARVAGKVTMKTSDNSALSSGATLYYGSKTGDTFPTNHHFTITQAAHGGIATGFFSRAHTTVTTDSSLLAKQAANGSVTLQHSTLTLKGTNTNTDYFSVTASQLARTSDLEISAPTGATVIVNVSGKAVDFENADVTISGTTANNVLFNFDQATSLTLTGDDFNASILAPLATLSVPFGMSQGNVMVANISNGSDWAFDNGDLFTGNPQINSVPEPSSMVLSSFGPIVISLLAWRRRALSRARG